MRRLLPLGVGLVCITALLIGCYGPVLFHGEQFSFRDAGHFYYPLYQRVQQEWQAGRLPLWSPEENAGMPLLGNPTAAVLYPGKLIYAVFPYAWAARLYPIAHSLLALATMYVLMRSWDVSRVGSGLSAIGYAFGAPILFQYCNIIFLVGAAWAPLGIKASDGWLRLGKRWAIAELAIVLAMQTLGGEPQSAYIVGLCAASYAVALSRSRTRSAGYSASKVWLLGVIAVLGWIGLTIAAAIYFPMFRKQVMPPELLPWTPWVSSVVGVVWLVFAYRVWKARRDSTLWSMGLGLASAAVLGAFLSGMQLIPVLEFTSMTIRASLEGTHDALPFSLEPVRALELLWPSVFGNPYLDNRNWVVNIIPHSRPKYWIPSLYLGSLTLVLALSTFSRKSSSPVAWMKGIAIVSLVASFGEYSSPIYYAREIPALKDRIGVHDKPDQGTIRFDGKLRDGEGCPYSLLSDLLPGFRSFRYPSKLLSFTSLALAALAGFGWDRSTRRNSKGALRISIGLLVLSGSATLAMIVLKTPFLAWISGTVASRSQNSFGPFSPIGAWTESRNSVLHSTIVLAIAAILLILARRRPLVAGVLALFLSTGDVIVANARYVLTGPQSDFEGTPKILALIEEAERKDPSPGPYRVHRMPLWSPPGWKDKHSLDRIRDFNNWERDTIQPKYAIPYGLCYTMTEGTAELYDFIFFFAPFSTPAPRELAERFRVRPGDPLVYYPRRGFDLWGSRYFVLPGYPANDERRGIAMFFPDTEPIYPPPGRFSGPGGKEEYLRWIRDEDVQILRNKAAYPRAWAVHQLRFVDPIRGLKREDRKAVIEELLFANDLMWNTRSRILFDPHEQAWVETDDRGSLSSFRTGGAADPTETVRVVENLPDRVVLDAELHKPGVVVLADVFYPGWELTVDTVPSPILRVNRIMRGAAVSSGKHRLIYRYRPWSVWIGAVMSIAGLIGLIGLGIWSFSARSIGRSWLESEHPGV